MPCARSRVGIGLTILVLSATASVAQSITADPREAAAETSTRERLDAWRRSIDQRAALLSAPARQTWIEPIEGEVPCSRIDEVALADAVDGALPSRLGRLTSDLGRFHGACLGVRSIEALRTNLEARVAALGYVTSTLTVPAQDLAGGRLTLTLHLGRLAGWRIETAGAALSAEPAANAVALQAGSVLNLRDIEQALENLNRLPSQAAGFRIEPGAAPGTSQVVIVPAGGSRWHGSLAAETTDTPSYGPLQYNAGLSWDAPLGMSDQINLMGSLAQRAAADGHARQSTALLSYSVPWGAHLFSVQWSRTAHLRPIQGGVSRFIEQGSDVSTQLRWQWTAWRNGSSRLSLWAGSSRRLTRTLLEDTELLLRRRDSANLDAGITLWQRHGCGDQSLEVDGGRVLRLARDESFQSLPSHLPSTWRVQWSWDCALASPRGEGAATSWLVTGRLWAQGVRHPAGSIDLVSLGSRWTVRGQDPSATLSGQGAWVARHELTSPSQPLGAQGAVRWFAGIDHGRIRQALDLGQAHHQLTGLASGLRWAWTGTTGEVTAARPLGRQVPGAEGATWQASMAIHF